MLFLRLSNYQQQQGNSFSPIKPYTNKRFRLSVSVADGKIISYQLWEMQNYFDNFIYQKDPKIYFFDDVA
ncbi:hypothetical protein [Parabacteroides johnsonii]|jgi:hypothetical protein|uniref:hypothetical protein n=1 Tax=Parabacteroides johnsonii TaxID=387661 RepID=UPI00307E23C7